MSTGSVHLPTENAMIIKYNDALQDQGSDKSKESQVTRKSLIEKISKKVLSAQEELYYLQEEIDRNNNSLRGHLLRYPKYRRKMLE